MRGRGGKGVMGGGRRKIRADRETGYNENKLRGLIMSRLKLIFVFR